MEVSVKALLITFISIATFAVGFLLSITGNQVYQVIPPATTSFTLTIITFGFGLLFFGYFPWIITFFAGEYFGLAFKLQEQTIIQIALASLAIILISFSSTWMGTSLYNDLRGKQSHFYKEIKKNTIIITIALILAIASQLLPY